VDKDSQTRFLNWKQRNKASLAYVWKQENRDSKQIFSQADQHRFFLKNQSATQHLAIEYPKAYRSTA